jgi:rubrerythrin
MALPKIDSPIFELDLPLSGNHIRFRPFLVKEQKNLLMALEADDVETINNNIKQVLNNCLLDDNLDIDTLPILDIEYYFLNLRARSVSEVVEAKYKCNNPVDDKECGNIMDANINVLDIKVTKDENIKEIIQINDTIAVKLKYPTFSSIANAAEVKDVNEIALQMVVDSIDTIYDGQQSFPAKESSKSELMEFVESLNQHQFQKIQEFFENLPKLDKLINLKCKKCGFDHVIVFEGLESFFD